MIKIIHDRCKCIGCGICVELQPERWCMSRWDGKATLVKAVVKNNISILPVSRLYQYQIQELAAACPVKIIKISK